MAAVHFTKILYKPYTALKVQGKLFFAIFVHALTTLRMRVLGFKILKLF